MGYRYIRSDELYHYGILGMKWGVRRFQNEDGTLTAAGKERYGVEEASKQSTSDNRHGLGRSREVHVTGDGKGIKLRNRKDENGNDIEDWFETYVPSTTYSNMGGYYRGSVMDAVQTDIPDELEKLLESLDSEWEGLYAFREALKKASDYQVSLEGIVWGLVVLDYCNRHPDAIKKVPGMRDAVDSAAFMRAWLQVHEDDPEFIKNLESNMDLYNTLKE